MTNNILIVNKSSNLTSNQSIQKIKNILNIKKIGYCGTLDPLATGVLIICINKSTKLLPHIVNTKKRYIIEIYINIKTITNDIQGLNIFIKKKNKFYKNNINIINIVKNDYIQNTPIFSAIKYKGISYYKYAKNNIKLNRKKTYIILYDSKIIKQTKNTWTLDITCSKGTYMREIISKIGKSIFKPISISMICRISCGKYNICDSYILNKY